MTADLITTEPGNEARVAGTRITVQHIAEHSTYLGWTTERIAHAFRLTTEQVDAALSYYYDHKAAIDQAIEADQSKDLDLPRLQDMLNTPTPARSAPQRKVMRRISDKGIVTKSTKAPKESTRLTIRSANREQPPSTRPQTRSKKSDKPK